jgi:hypothetical protein
MTSQSPRIYIYKITFEEVLYYYYGVHKEKKFGEYYCGTPITHKWCWEIYTPKKQILQIFDYTDDGWLEAQEIEERLIRPFYNTDKWCLNENCAGKTSLIQRSKAGKKGSVTNKENKTGIFALTKEQLSDYGKKSYELGVGIHSLTEEEKNEISKKAGILVRDMKIGIFGLSEDEKIKNASKGGKIGGKVTSSQKWICLETGYVGNPGVLTLYQKKRNIDTSKRKKINNTNS